MNESQEMEEDEGTRRHDGSDLSVNMSEGSDDTGLSESWPVSQETSRKNAKEALRGKEAGGNFVSVIILLKKKRFYVFLFRQRGRQGEGEGEKHQGVVASHPSPIGDLARNPGMCPDWESNLRPFGSQTSTQSTEPHQCGL